MRMAAWISIGIRWIFLIPENSSIKYDSAVYQISVSFEDDGNGNISAKETITKDGNPAQEVVFINESLVEMPLTGSNTG